MKIRIDSDVISRVKKMTAIEVIQAALDDVEYVFFGEDYSSYEASSCDWHFYETGEDTCEVCLAGCLIANTLKVPYNKDIYPDDKTAGRIASLDKLAGHFFVLDNFLHERPNLFGNQAESCPDDNDESAPLYELYGKILGGDHDPKDDECYQAFIKRARDVLAVYAKDEENHRIPD